MRRGIVSIIRVAQGEIKGQITFGAVTVSFSVPCREARDAAATRTAILSAAAAALSNILHESRAQQYVAGLGPLIIDLPDPPAPPSITRVGSFISGQVAPGIARVLLVLSGQELSLTPNKHGLFSVHVGTMTATEISATAVDSEGHHGASLLI